MRTGYEVPPTKKVPSAYYIKPSIYREWTCYFGRIFIEGDSGHAHNFIL